jgi:hypothetical protein
VFPEAGTICVCIHSSSGFGWALDVHKNFSEFIRVKRMGGSERVLPIRILQSLRDSNRRAELAHAPNRAVSEVMIPLMNRGVTFLHVGRGGFHIKERGAPEQNARPPYEVGESKGASSHASDRTLKRIRQPDVNAQTALSLPRRPFLVDGLWS